MSAPQPRPITILIAALGGEGGGVLTDWIVSAAAQLNFPMQSTSIPGVAQRTGATTYYIEIVPVPAHELPARPVLALAPGVGLDVLEVLLPGVEILLARLQPRVAVAEHGLLLLDRPLQSIDFGIHHDDILCEVGIAAVERIDRISDHPLGETAHLGNHPRELLEVDVKGLDRVLGHRGHGYLHSNRFRRVGTAAPRKLVNAPHAFRRPRRPP